MFNKKSDFKGGLHYARYDGIDIHVLQTIAAGELLYIHFQSRSSFMIVIDLFCFLPLKEFVIFQKYYFV